MAGTVEKIKKLTLGKPQFFADIPKRLSYSSTSRNRWQGFGFSLLSVAVATFLMFVLHLEPYNVNMVFMFLTLVSTVWFGLGAGSLTAVLSFLSFDFFFIPPYFTLVIDAFQGWTAVFLFFGTALFANQVAGRARLGYEQAHKRAQEATALYELATAVLTRIDQREMLLVVMQKASEVLKAQNCTLYLQEEKNEATLVESAMIEAPGYGGAPHRHPDPAIAQTVFRQNHPSYFPDQPVTINQTQGYGEVVFTNSVAYLPLSYGSQVLGVMVIVGPQRENHVLFSTEEKRLIQVFANHVALAVEHAHLIRESAQLQALRESDTLKTSLLASVSHELRTPLTSIKTASANLRIYENIIPDQEYGEIINLIEQETERLARLVSNLLDLSRIEGHALAQELGWY
jgi:two-component system sensor histidine kinase KdpD